VENVSLVAKAVSLVENVSLVGKAVSLVENVSLVGKASVLLRMLFWWVRHPSCGDC
jgi:hypothetical protein